MNLNNYLPLAQEFVTSFFVFIFLSFIVFKFFRSFFPISIASDRSALSHEPTLRGIGIIFPIFHGLSFYESVLEILLIQTL